MASGAIKIYKGNIAAIPVTVSASDGLFFSRRSNDAVHRQTSRMHSCKGPQIKKEKWKTLQHGYSTLM